MKIHLARPLMAALAVAALLATPASLLADANHAKGDLPAHISYGEEVRLADYLVPGKTTVFDFFSEYCGPCRRLSPRLEKLHQAREDIAVVKVDINRPDVKGIDWHSPVAQEFGLESIPHLKVYGPDGKLLAEGDAAYEMVSAWLN
jgi:thiol-disulfide isomerase/thioredoxin